MTTYVKPEMVLRVFTTR